MESALRPVLVIGFAVLLTLVVGWSVDRSLRAADARHPETPLWHLLRRCRLPLQVVICTAILRGAYRAAHVGSGHSAAIGQALTLVLIGATAWLLVRVATAVTDSSYARY